MIERILPGEVVVVETRKDLLDARLFPEEEAAIANAVEKRRREYATVRACAHEALRKLGLASQPISNGERGEPLWPGGVVGSITHCDGYRACVLARASAVVTVGIDAEPNAPLPDGVLGEIARPEERLALESSSRAMPAVHWDRLLFSAKESVYKAWFPLAKSWLGFEDAVVTFEPAGASIGSRTETAAVGGAMSGGFSARLLVDGPRLGDRELVGFSGEWLVSEGLVLTAIAIRARAASPR